VSHGPASIFIKDARFLLTMDPERRLLEGASIAITGPQIAAIGDTRELVDAWVGPNTEIIDASDRFVTPGLINAHIHLESCYDKGLLTGIPIVRFLEHYFSYTYGTLTEESYYYAALASLLACLKTGTTTVSDCGTIQTMESSAVRAVTNIGMRAVLARDLMDIHTPTPAGNGARDAFTDLLGHLQENTQQCLERSEKFINDFHQSADGRVRTSLDLQQLCDCSPDLCQGTRRLADEYGVGIQAHVAFSHDTVEMTRKRFGMGDVEYLQAQGVTGPDFLAAHVQWTNARELIILKETGSNLVHVPGASLHCVLSVLSDRGRMPDYVNAGINVALGNDESSTGTCHDLVRDMYIVSTAHAETHQPVVFPDRDLFMSRSGEPCPVALEMATVNGAQALNWEDEIGSLEAEKKADVVLWDLTSYEWTPTLRQNVLNNFIYNGTGRSAHTVICNGKKIVEGGTILTVDEHEVCAKVQEFAEQYIPRATWLEQPEVWELAWVPE